MASKSDSLFFFLNQLGSRVRNDGQSELPRTPQHLSCSSEGDMLTSDPAARFCLPSLALFKTIPESDGGVHYDFGKTKVPHKQDRKIVAEGSTAASSASASSWAKERAVRNLSAPVWYRSLSDCRTHGSRDTVRRASDSFSFLLVANLRRFFAVQLRRHTRSSGACAAKTKEIASAFLKDKKCIDVMGASTSFNLEECESHGGNVDETKALDLQRVSFHMKVDVCVLETKMSILVKASGTLKATFEPGTSRIAGATLAVDPNELLLSMRTQARLLVLKAVAKGAFPIIHSDAPVGVSAGAGKCPPQLSTEEDEVPNLSSSPNPEEAEDAPPPSLSSEEGDKMKKLALCASIELASVINDSSPLMQQQQQQPQQHRSSSAKRRLSAALGGSGSAATMLVLPGSKRAMLSQSSQSKTSPEGKLGALLPALSANGGCLAHS